ncbi:MAG: hypothetical protein ABL926_01815 [Novosphingobium sp.]|uniref:hypothetical protein n=1 Tax=Novosphingobium sp. TaxID=1874826 RepID=UPI0032B7EFD4
MAENEPAADVDVTKAWAATQDQKGQAKKLRIYAALCWLVAIGTEVAGIVMLKQGKFQSGNMALLIGLLVVIAAFAIGGSLLWKAANKHDPASRADGFRFFVQNQLGAIITLIAFLPLLVLIFMDKDMDPKNKKIAGGVGVALALLATVIGIDFKPPSVEQYTEDMNQCAAQIKSGQPTTACSPEVAQQAQDIARDSKAVADATKTAANPNGIDKVYWIASEKAGEKADTEHVFHLCDNVSTLRGKEVQSGSVTAAYKENATRITKQLAMEQKQCGFGAGGGVAGAAAKAVKAAVAAPAADATGAQ